MRYVVLVCLSFVLGAWCQSRTDSAFVASTFHSSTYNFEENVMQGAAMLDMCEAQARAK